MTLVVKYYLLVYVMLISLVLAECAHRVIYEDIYLILEI